MPEPPVDDRMSLWQWLRTPAALHRFGKRRWDVHTLYLPRATVERVKRAVTVAAGGGGPRLSTNDCLTALLLTLQNDLRGRPLVPAEGHVVTSNSGGAQEGWGRGAAVSGRLPCM